MPGVRTVSLLTMVGLRRGPARTVSSARVPGMIPRHR